MSTSESVRWQDYLEELTHPRRCEGIGPLIQGGVLAFCAAICRAADFVTIPKLLETLEIAGSLVTIDAMDCQV